MARIREPHRRTALLLAIIPLALGAAAGCTETAAASGLRPAPEAAGGDRGRVFRDGCLVDQRSRATRRCVYGSHSRVTVVLFGDSEAMQFFPPLLRVVRASGWRLVTRLRAGCTPAAIKFSHRCDHWRDRTLRLIARRDRPNLVVVTGGVAYRAIRDGRRLSSRRSAPWLRRGYARTLRRLRRSGARVAVIKDTPRSPRHIPDCVVQHLDEPGRCSFSRRQPTNRIFDLRAARLVRGATLLDPTPVVCPGRSCPAVKGDVLVYRDAVHFTATFAAELTGWLRSRLPRPAR
ncbi:MAG TPA: SGNH hydrolase domain-containing protein [Thermoleophilaceae bacterium]|nr:SGNH hydrolase domain-containing protein [Thermoleophilaceae bacterium]